VQLHAIVHAYVRAGAEESGGGQRRCRGGRWSVYHDK